MSLKRLLSVAAFMVVVTLSFSCDKESTSEMDQDYYGLDKDEVTNENI